MSAAKPTPLPPDLISPTILERLHNAGVDDCETWVRLKDKRKLIFGIPLRSVMQIDAAVRDTMRARS